MGPEPSQADPVAALAPVAALSRDRLGHEPAPSGARHALASDLGLRLGLALRTGRRRGRRLGARMAPRRAVVFPGGVAGQDQLRALHVPRSRALDPRAIPLPAPLVP